MIKVKDGYAKLIGTTYSGSVSRVLLSNGGDHILGNSSGNIPLNNGTINTNLNADMLDGLHIHAGRNNEANKIVRTDANGFILAGWINTTSGDIGTGTINKIYCSDDNYIRYKTPANFFPTLANDGNQISITIGSQNRKLTVNYASFTKTLDKVSLPSSTSNAANTAWCKFARITFNNSAWSTASGYLFFGGSENPDNRAILVYHFRSGNTATTLSTANLYWLVKSYSNATIIAVKAADNVYDLYTNNSGTYLSPCIYHMSAFSSKFTWSIGNWTTTKPTAAYTSSDIGIVNYANSASNADTVDGLHLYTRNLGINGSSWTFASTANANATTHIYAATSAGTSGQILKSTGGTPTWMNQSDLTTGKVTCTVGTADVFRPIVLTNESNQLYYNTKIKGNYSTGKIQLSGIEIEDAAGNTPLIRFGSANKNSILWKVYSNDTTYANQGVYGFDMTYFGTGSGNANRLVLHADNQNSATKVEAMSITQDGVVTFSKTISGSINGNANTVDGQHFNWNNNKNDHTYLWAATDNGNAYLVHRASISVNYANSAGNADTLDGYHANAFAAASHSHPYLLLSGGTMTGVIKSTYTSSTWINGVTNAILKGEYTGYGAIISMPVKDGRVSLSSYPANDNNIYFGYATTALINAGTNSFNKQMFWDAANNNLHAGVFTGYLSGNASTASKWLNARTLTIGNIGKTVDGSGNVSWTLAEIGAATSGHTHTLSLASDTGTSSITLAHGGKYKLTAGGNSVIFTLPTVNNTNPTNYYWANIKVSATSNMGTTPRFGKVKINTASSTYQLNVSGDSYVTNWCRAGKGLYLESSNIYFAYSDKSNTTAEIDLLSNNEFCWGANSDTLYFNYKLASRNATTVTKYVWNAGSSSTYATHTTGNIILGNKSYLITRSGCTSDWYNGRNNAMIRITSANTCSALTSIKTRNGSWEMGNGLLINDYLYFSYVSDSAFNNADYDYVPPLVYFSSAGVHATRFYELSDIRYKKILRNLSINSNTIATLPLFDFEWIENNIIGTGTSALAVLLILPNLVSGTDRLTLDYGVLGTIAGVTACKELVTLKSELLQLKEKIKELEDKLRKYENI